jgi:hypothetical protein
MRPLQFLSTKSEVLVLNVGEKDLNTEDFKKLQSSLNIRYPSLPVLTICGKIEMEIAQLSPDDARLFLDELGLDEPVSNKLIHTCYHILGLISFFTYVGDEVKAQRIKGFLGLRGRHMRLRTGILLISGSMCKVNFTFFINECATGNDFSLIFGLSPSEVLKN